VTGKELQEAEQTFRKADDAYYNAKGWFWSCDYNCQQKKAKRDIAEQRVMMVKQKRDDIVSEARQKVGTVGGGVYYMAKNAAKQQRLHGGQGGYAQQQRMQYRAHYD